MRELSVFIDESGDFGPYEHHSPMYIIALVFHDQSVDIAPQISRLKQRVSDSGFPSGHNIHSAPLIRREKDYSCLDMPTRKRLFRALADFVRMCDISCKTFVFHKREFHNHDQMVSRISREIGGFVRDNLLFFQGFDRIIVYYDNGQKEITNIVNTIFNVFLDAQIRNVSPSDYALFQAADMACTLTLLEEKVSDAQLTKSELDFFHSVRDLRKNYLRPFDKKKFSDRSGYLHLCKSC